MQNPNRKENILLTGGTGYIGSHTYLDLYRSGYNPIIIDNLSNSHLEIVKKLELITNDKVIFKKGDITNYSFLEKIFIQNQISGIIHFAALKSIPESYRDPKKFYKTNVGGTENLLRLCKKYYCNYFIFSSSAAVYSNKNKLPFKETSKIKGSNPYSLTKLKSEKKIIQYAKKNKHFRYVILRYFNPVGSEKNTMIGEFPKKTMGNLMPEICKVAAKKKKYLKIFGNDYNTHDGSCIRDFIHVSDLSLGHLAALKHLKSNKKNNIYNLGSGKGYSVLEIVRIFEKVNKVKVPIRIFTRRKGDAEISYADTTQARSQLGWRTKYKLQEMCRSSWLSHKRFNK